MGMGLFKEKQKFERIIVRTQEYLIFAACFFYLLFFIHPVLILEALPPVFLLNWGFLGGFLSIPGGMTDWLSALLMQFWFSDFLISLFLTGSFWIVSLLTKKWLETVIEKRPVHTIHLVPACLLLILYSQYYFPPGIMLALIINLSVLNLFARWNTGRGGLRGASDFIVSALLFWITGAAFLVFVVLYGLQNLFFRKRIMSGLLLLVIQPLLPYIASQTFFLVPVREAYMHNLIFEIVTNLRLNAFILPAFFLALPILVLIVKIPLLRKPIGKIGSYNLIWKCAAGTFLLVGGSVILRQVSYNETVRVLLQIDRDVKEERWMSVIESVPEWPSVNGLFVFQTNLSLYKTGMLLDRMFAYPQQLGTTGLLMNFDLCSACSEQTSNLYWMLGLLSESQHWAHEAFEQKGYTADLLKRLGIIYMLKGYNGAAEKFFLNLEDVPFQGKTAEKLLRLNENPDQLAEDPDFNRIKSMMPVEDVPLTGNPSLLQLELLLKRNPKNKMAFDYMIAYHLLAGNVRAVVGNIFYFKALGYPQLPVHVQEALLIVASQTPNFDENIVYTMVERKTFERFVEFQKMLNENRWDLSAAKRELAKQYSDTYWYYIIFLRPPVKQPEEHNAYTR
jgi:hypothetical protein